MLSFKENISLAPLNSYKIGGKARYFFEAKNLPELQEAVVLAHEKSLPIFVLAGGTNLLISDTGYDGLVLKPHLQNMHIAGSEVYAEAGVSMRDLLELAIENSLSGLAWAGGLPGSFGGAIRGNAGAFGGEMKDNIIEITSLDISKKPKLITRNRNECKFGYRTSIFKEQGNEIIVSGKLALSSGDKKTLLKERDEKIRYRLERHPMEYPNAGSMFKNIPLALVPEAVQEQFKSAIKTDPFPVMPVAALIAAANLQGVSFGGASISPKHPNFIVNNLTASADDVKALTALVKETIYDKFKVLLEEEIIFL